jgi:hypothetical protein
MKRITLFTLAIHLIASSAFAEEFGGIEFPQGGVSFADVVVSYTQGSPPPTDPDHIDPLDALGVPDHPGGNNQPGSVSLGRGGNIVLEFTNNLLTGSDDSAPDIHIFEVGSDVEDTFVEISTDGVTWEAIGKVFGSTSSIDIDAFGFTSADQFRFVRLTDDPNEGQQSGDTVGADIDAVGAISTNQVVDNPPIMIETAILVKFQSALGSVYTIEESTNLENWSDAIADISGDGEILKFFFEITTPRKFYRLKPPAE